MNLNVIEVYVILIKPSLRIHYVCLQEVGRAFILPTCLAPASVSTHFVDWHMGSSRDYEAQNGKKVTTYGCE